MAMPNELELAKLHASNIVSLNQRIEADRSCIERLLLDKRVRCPDGKIGIVRRLTLTMHGQVRLHVAPPNRKKTQEIGGLGLVELVT